MFDISTLNKIDKQKMYKTYDQWPKIAKESYKAKHDVFNYKDIDHIVFAGMGGSGAVGDLFSSILSKTDMHVSLVKGYHLPKTVDSNTLVVVSSVSGNTIEALTVLDAAAKSDCKLIAFSSGGKIKQYCEKNKINYKSIDMIHSPRASFLRYVYTMLVTLESVLPIKKQSILESIIALDKLSKKIRSDNLTKINPALNLASWICGIPMIYYPWGLQAAAIRFKNSLQENAKTHAMIEDVIEACHNGIIAWETPSNVNPILIRGKDDYVKTKKQWLIIKEYFDKHDIRYKEVFSIPGNILSKLVCLIYFLDYTSIYYAVLHNIDPSPVTSIDFIKKRMKFSAT